MYAQDSWRARSNVTLDLGVRYSLYPPLTDTNNMLVTFDPKLYNNTTAPPYTNAAGTLVNYAVGDPLVGLIVAGKNSPMDAASTRSRRTASAAHRLRWIPPATATRSSAAFGIYYDQPLVGIFEQNTFTSPPFVTTCRSPAAP